MKQESASDVANERTHWTARADRASLVGMGLGLALMLLVPSPWSFRAGFFVVLGSTVAQIVFSHCQRSEA